MESDLKIDVPESVIPSSIRFPSFKKISASAPDADKKIHKRQESLGNEKLTNTSLEKRINLEEKFFDLFIKKEYPDSEALEYRKEMINMFSGSEEYGEALKFFESCFDSELKELWRLSLGLSIHQIKSCWKLAIEKKSKFH